MNPRNKIHSKLARIVSFVSLTLMLVLAFPTAAHAQDSLPFAVSNPKHQKWGMEEAGRCGRSGLRIFTLVLFWFWERRTMRRCALAQCLRFI